MFGTHRAESAIPEERPGLQSQRREHRPDQNDQAAGASSAMLSTRRAESAIPQQETRLRPNTCKHQRDQQHLAAGASIFMLSTHRAEPACPHTVSEHRNQPQAVASDEAKDLGTQSGECTGRRTPSDALEPQASRARTQGDRCIGRHKPQASARRPAGFSSEQGGECIGRREATTAIESAAVGANNQGAECIGRREPDALQKIEAENTSEQDDGCTGHQESCATEPQSAGDTDPAACPTLSTPRAEQTKGTTLTGRPLKGIPQRWSARSGVEERQPQTECSSTGCTPTAAPTKTVDAQHVKGDTKAAKRRPAWEIPTGENLPKQTRSDLVGPRAGSVNPRLPARLANLRPSDMRVSVHIFVRRYGRMRGYVGCLQDEPQARGTKVLLHVVRDGIVPTQVLRQHFPGPGFSASGALWQSPEGEQIVGGIRVFQELDGALWGAIIKAAPQLKMAFIAAGPPCQDFSTAGALMDLTPL